jgi:hypothetical protein
MNERGDFLKCLADGGGYFRGRGQGVAGILLRM